MLKRLLSIIFFVFIVCNISAAKPTESDSIEHHQLLIKTEVLLPFFGLIDPENNSMVFGISGELKFNSKISTQVSVYHFHYNKNDHDNKSIMLISEGRYYLRNHFFGLYFKYSRGRLIYLNYTSGNNEVPSNLYAIGPLYGYQREFGKLNIEGFLNLGISKTFYPQGDFYGNNNDVFVDILFGIRLGRKLF